MPRQASRRFLGLSALRAIFGAGLEQESSGNSWSGSRPWGYKAGGFCLVDKNLVCGAPVLVK